MLSSAIAAGAPLAPRVKPITSRNCRRVRIDDFNRAWRSRAEIINGAIWQPHASSSAVVTAIVILRGIAHRRRPDHLREFQPIAACHAHHHECLGHASAYQRRAGDDVGDIKSCAALASSSREKIGADCASIKA